MDTFNFANVEQFHGAAVAILFLMCMIGTALGSFIAGRDGAERIEAGARYSIGAIVIFLGGWMVIDYLCYPEYHKMDLATYVSHCGTSTLSVISGILLPVAEFLHPLEGLLTPFRNFA